MSARLGDRLLSRLDWVELEQLLLQAEQRVARARQYSLSRHLDARKARYARALRVLARVAARLASLL